MSEPQEKVIFFADVVGSTRLYESLGDETAHQCISKSLDKVASQVTELGGRVVEIVGDEAMVLFDDIEAACLCACVIHRYFDSHSTECGTRLQFRIGFYRGPVGFNEGHPFGDTVNVASRLCSIASGGQTITSEDSLLGHVPSPGYLCQAFGQVSVKGKSEALSIFKVEWDLAAATALAKSRLLATSSPEAEVLTLTHNGRQLTVSKERSPFTVGRDLDCDHTVNSLSSSRVHLRLEVRSGAWYVIDHSTNGTFIEWHSPTEKSRYPQFRLHHGEHMLTGEGQIGLGRTPVMGEETCIEFACFSSVPCEA